MSPPNLLNPAAGDVPIPEDQREIDAALRAGRISQRIFPYFEWRYGERGKKFTRSDSAWLAWLTRFDTVEVYQQIAWLRNILSNRGMPSWLLERHLVIMHRQLTRRIPENESKYRSLANSAGQLRQAREEIISPRREQQLVADFVAGFSAGSGQWLVGAARLIIAAAADMKLGAKNAITSLETRLADVTSLRNTNGLRQQLSEDDRHVLDSESFERRWKKAIAKTIAKARKP